MFSPCGTLDNPLTIEAHSMDAVLLSQRLLFLKTMSGDDVKLSRSVSFVAVGVSSEAIVRSLATI